jgi:hypothetical protein
MPFQNQAYTTLSPGVEGDFASSNPRATVLAGPGGLVAGPSGVYIGRFAWLSPEYLDADNAPTVLNSYGSGPVTGFVGRRGQGLITTYLADNGLLIPQGLQVAAYSEGDFWVRNSGSGQALVGQVCYAALASGLASFATGSSAASTASGSASSVAASTFSVTGSVLGNVLSVTTVGSGTIYPGATVSGTNIASGSMVSYQISGTAGGIGTYALNIGEQSAASTTVSGTYGTLTVGGTVTGIFVNGGLLAGTGVAAGTYVTAFITGAGGAGTYVVNNNTVVSSTSISATTNVATKFTAMSSGNAGELVKISSWPNG